MHTGPCLWVDKRSASFEFFKENNLILPSLSGLSFLDTRLHYFTGSHKPTKGVKGLLTPLLDEKLPFYLTREKERK